MLAFSSAIEPGATSVLLIARELMFGLRVRHNLAMNGHQVASVDSAASGLAEARAFQPDIIIAELELLELPESPELPFLPQLRAINGTAPLLVVGERAPLGTALEGFRIGVDEFLRLPVSLLDLHARIDFMLRHAVSEAGAPAPVGESFRVGHTEVYPARRLVVRDGVTIPLTHKEFKLLMTLVAAGGAIVPRQELLRAVWGHDGDTVTRTVEMHILKLRRKVERDPRRPRHILVAPKAGYRFQR